MSDKLEQIEKILTQIYISNGYNFEFSDAAQQILDICQPQWIYTDDLSPSVEPHRNIEIAYTDSINTIFTTEISSRMIPNINFYAWRELEDIPAPRTSHDR